jgi:hypothetical protein
MDVVAGSRGGTPGTSANVTLVGHEHSAAG